MTAAYSCAAAAAFPARSVESALARRLATCIGCCPPAGCASAATPTHASHRPAATTRRRGRRTCRWFGLAPAERGASHSRNTSTPASTPASVPKVRTNVAIRRTFPAWPRPTNETIGRAAASAAPRNQPVAQRPATIPPAIATCSATTRHPAAARRPRARRYASRNGMASALSR